MDDNDPYQQSYPTSSTPPPEPEPYRSPDRLPSEPPPYMPPDLPNSTDPTNSLWWNGWLWRLPVVALGLVLIPCLAYAATAGGGGAMPWDTPLSNIKTDLTGTTAGYVSLIGAFCALVVIIWGGEIGHLVRVLCYIVFCASVLVGLASLYTQIGIAGATVESHNIVSLETIIVSVVGLALLGIGGRQLYRRYRQRRLARQVEP